MTNRRKNHFTAAALASVVSIAPAAFAPAQEQPAAAAMPPAAPAADTGPLPGHSAHGETFDEGPRRAAYLMGNTGGVHLAVTAKHPDAQKFFDQGVGQLHGFWYLEAERSFRQVAALDRDCAMAYWGMAMANLYNPKRARAFVAEAAKRKGQAGITPKELRWIDALDAFYKDEPKDENARKKNFVEALRKMAADFPDDVEPKAFAVRYAWEFRGDPPQLDYEASNKALDEIFAVAPHHPAHHYRIHVWDDKDASRALDSAAKAGPAGPGIAHLWHMPGHTYSKLNRLDDAAWQQEASARVDHAYMIRDRVMPYEIHNYAHNNEWLVRNLAYVGRVRDAIDLAKNMTELPRHPKYNLATNRGSGAGLGRARLIDVLGLHEMWDELLALCDSVYLKEDGDVDQQIHKVRHQGVACAALGRKDEAMAHLATLERLKAQAKVEGYEAAAKAREEAKKQNKTPEEITKAGDEARKASVERVAAIDKAVAHINAQQATAAGDFAAAADLLAKADARKAHLSQAHLRAGDLAKAQEVAKQAVDEKKNQVYPLANYVQVLWQCGKKDEAKAAFDQLRELSSRIDLSVRPYSDLQPIAAAFGHGADWRKLRTPPADLGLRPDLDALGPFRWRPSPAPDFTAVAADGGAVSLAGYRGKPVVVVFYLGYGCLHCTQQLQAFAPLGKEFNDAGISIVGVSTDAPADLHRAWENAKLDAPAAGAPAGFPFPLASDAGLDVFRRYGCFDDFEQKPLHGTFLMDGQGRIRWQDVAAEPFTDTRFLLDEAKRLLAQP